MTCLALIRHGPTAWNEVGRVQGQSDVPLSARGRALVTTWRLPAELAGFDWLASPLRRARETATILGAPPPLATDARLAEMHWGAWEGETLAYLRARYGDEMIRNEARGLDFRTAGGESYRELRARVRDLLAALAAAGRPTLAVTHKGVIRAVLSLATGWEMRDKPPCTLVWTAAHLFTLAGDGTPAVARLNLPLGGEERDW